MENNILKNFVFMKRLLAAFSIMTAFLAVFSQDSIADHAFVNAYWESTFEGPYSFDEADDYDTSPNDGMSGGIYSNRFSGSVVLQSAVRLYAHSTSGTMATFAKIKDTYFIYNRFNPSMTGPIPDLFLDIRYSGSITWHDVVYNPLPSYSIETSGGVKLVTTEGATSGVLTVPVSANYREPITMHHRFSAIATGHATVDFSKTALIFFRTADPDIVLDVTSLRGYEAPVICNGDADFDKDIDGLDVYERILNFDPLELANFAISFGRTNCP